MNKRRNIQAVYYAISMIICNCWIKEKGEVLKECTKKIQKIYRKVNISSRNTLMKGDRRLKGHGLDFYAKGKLLVSILLFYA